MEVGGKELPEDWPGDIPLPDGYEILQVANLSNEEGDSSSVTLELPGDGTDIADELHEEMLAAGYPETGSGAIKQETGDDHSSYINIYASEEYQVMLNVMSGYADEGVVRVQYRVGSPEEE